MIDNISLEVYRLCKGYTREDTKIQLLEYAKELDLLYNVVVHTQQDNTADIVTVKDYFNHMKTIKGHQIFHNVFTPEGVLTNVCHNTQTILKGAVGINFLDYLTETERANVRINIASITHRYQVRHHMESVQSGNHIMSIKWINKGNFRNGTLMDIESIGFPVSMQIAPPPSLN